MRKHRNIALTLIFILFMVPVITFGEIFYNDTNINGPQNSRGVGLGNRPVGGKVIKTGKTPAIVCAAMYGPIFMRVFNAAPFGQIFIRGSLAGRTKVNGYLLANYQIVPDLGTCTNPETGVPIPAFELKPYGVSK